MALYHFGTRKIEMAQPTNKSSEVAIVCPWCKKGLSFEFTHNHTYQTTSKLVSINKLEGKKVKN